MLDVIGYAIRSVTISRPCGSVEQHIDVLVSVLRFSISPCCVPKLPSGGEVLMGHEELSQAAPAAAVFSRVVHLRYSLFFVKNVCLFINLKIIYLFVHFCLSKIVPQLISFLEGAPKRSQFRLAPSLRCRIDE